MVYGGKEAVVPSLAIYSRCHGVVPGLAISTPRISFANPQAAQRGTDIDSGRGDVAGIMPSKCWNAVERGVSLRSELRAVNEDVA